MISKISKDNWIAKKGRGITHKKIITIRPPLLSEKEEMIHWENQLIDCSFIQEHRFDIILTTKCTDFFLTQAGRTLLCGLTSHVFCAHKSGGKSKMSASEENDDGGGGWRGRDDWKLALIYNCLDSQCIWPVHPTDVGPYTLYRLQQRKSIHSCWVHPDAFLPVSFRGNGTSFWDRGNTYYTAASQYVLLPSSVVLDCQQSKAIESYACSGSLRIRQWSCWAGKYNGAYALASSSYIHKMSRLFLK